MMAVLNRVMLTGTAAHILIHMDWNVSIVKAISSLIKLFFINNIYMNLNVKYYARV